MLSSQALRELTIDFVEAASRDEDIEIENFDSFPAEQMINSLAGFAAAAVVIIAQFEDLTVDEVFEHFRISIAKDNN